MNRKLVRYDVDLTDLPLFTEAQKVELETLSIKPEGEIDYGDIPPLADAFWKNAVRNPLYRLTKTRTILRREMLTSLKP